MSGSIRLGIAPIGWTNDDMPELGGEITFERCIREMAEAGYQGCEVGNKFPRDPAVLKTSLSALGLEVCNAWFSCRFADGRHDETVEAFIAWRDFLRSAGARVIGASEQGRSIQGQMETPVLEAKPVFTDSEWGAVCAGLDELGDLAAEVDMTLTYHHHMGTGVQTAGEIDRLMDSTDPDRVFLLYDTGHLVFSGENPLAVLRKHRARVRHVHLKDVRPAVVDRVRREGLSFLKAVVAGAFTVPGDGAIDFRPVFRELRDSGYSGWYVVEAEQDPAKANPLDYARKARAYIREAAGI